MNERERPFRKLFERCDGSRRDNICAAGLLLHTGLLGTTTNDQNIEIVRFDEFCEIDRSTKKWLDKRDVKIRSRNRKRDPGEPRTTPDVYDPLTFIDQLADHCAVQKVSLPESGDFPRTDKSALDAIRSERLMIFLGQIKARTEHALSNCHQLIVVQRLWFHTVHLPASRGTSPNQ